jgi:DHA1 family bicyclomycin/chloramphenicol resistance-like MFS transporter
MKQIKVYQGLSHMRINYKSGAFTTLLGAITALSALSIDMSLPTLPAMTADLATRSVAAQWTVSVFVLGFAGGQLFLGPLSDRVGRRPVMLCGLVSYVVAGVSCAFASSIGILVAMRFVQGLSACAGAVVVRAIIRDLFDRSSAAAKQSIMTVVTTLAMLIAPIVGAWVLGQVGWRGVFGLLPLCGGVVFVLAFLIIPESRPECSTPRLGMIKAYVEVLKQPITLGNAFAAAFIFGGLFVFIAGSSTVFIRTLGISAQGFSWLFAIVAFGQLCGSTLNRILAVRVIPAKLIRVGSWFTFAAVALIFLCVALQPNIYVVTLTIALYAFALGMTNPNAIAAAMVPLPEYAGAASAIIGFLYFLLASIGGTMTGYIMPGTMRGMLMTMAIFGTAGLAVLVWLEVYQAHQVVEPIKSVYSEVENTTK